MSGKPIATIDVSWDIQSKFPRLGSRRPRQGWVGKGTYSRLVIEKDRGWDREKDTRRERGRIKVKERRIDRGTDRGVEGGIRGRNKGRDKRRI